MKNKGFTKRRAQVNRQLLSSSTTVLSSWLDGKIEGDQYVAINPLRDDKTGGSFKISLTTGVWKDFAVEDFAGPDLSSLYMKLNGLDESAALDALEPLQQSGTKILAPARRQSAKLVKAEIQSAPAPHDCHMPPDIHPDLGTPSMTWEYLTADGLRGFMVYRFETEKGKETRPVSYNPEKQDWQWKLPNSPLPIYHLDLITNDKEVTVVVVEGEKAADAASKHFPESISTTSASGSSNALKSDWSPLYGRVTTLIPDADEPGTKYAMTVAAELLVNGSEVFIIDTLELGWTNGEDVADYPDLNTEWLAEHQVPVRDWIGFKSMDELIIEAAARLSPLDYDRRKESLTDLLGGVNKRTLDSMVKQARQALDYSGEEDSENSSLFSDVEPWPEAVDGKALVIEIKSIIRSHVILSDHEAMAVALWVLLTYVFRAFRVCPRLLVSSPEKRCGKTTLLETVQAMSFRGLAAANISAAALFRGVEAWSPTLLIDEADTFLQGNDELRGILNSGHTKSTAYVLRTVGDQHEPKLFPTFAPIAIGMIKRPPDTLLDRSVVIRMQRKLGNDPVTPLPLEAENEYLHVRQKCLRWAGDNSLELVSDRELTPAEVGNDRARDNWIPLVAIAQSCGLLENAQAACLQLTLKEDESLTTELLVDIQQIFRDQGKDKLPSKTLVRLLVAMEERPWAEYDRGGPLTQNKLAQLLKSFDVQTHQAKEGAKNLKHYLLEHLGPLFVRYLEIESSGTPRETTATSLPNPGSPLKSRAAEVADEIAVADSNIDPTTTPSSTGGVTSNPNAEVADHETLPLPMEPATSPTGRAIRAGSEVATQNRVVTSNSSQSIRGVDHG
jgi:hypothetical protein